MSNTAIATLDKFLSARHDIMRQTMPSSMKVTPERIQKIVVAAVANDAKLGECTPASIWASVNKSIQLGLEPCSPLGHSYLVPFKNKGVMEATLIVGYKGLIALARRSGEIESVSVRTVREGDKFRVSFGHEEIIEHVPNLDMNGKATHYYAIIRYKGGGTSFEVLTRAQTDATRERSRAGSNGPWVTDYDAMAMKTAVKRAMRTAPLTVDLADAIEADDYNEIDVTPPRRAPTQKVPPESALPPASIVHDFASEGAAQEFAAMTLNADDHTSVAGPAVGTSEPVVPASSPEADLLHERIEGMESPDDYKDIADDLKAAKARTSNPMPKETYDNLASALVAKRDALKKGGGK